MARRHGGVFRVLALAGALAGLGPVAALGAGSEEESAAVEAELTDALRPLFGQLLAMAGSGLAAGSDAYEDALARSARAVTAARPDECDLDRLRADRCGMRPVLVPSAAMAPTIAEREAVMAVPVGAGSRLRRGDVVVFLGGPAGAGRPSQHVFRVIGLPGETVALRGGVVHVDGAAMPLAPTGETMPGTGGARAVPVFTETTPEGRRYRVAGLFGEAAIPGQDDTAPVLVPAGSYFVLGDNRHNAVDSRFPDRLGGPFVTTGSVLGRVAVIYVSGRTERIGRRVE